MAYTVLTLLKDFDQDPFEVSKALRDWRDRDLCAFELSSLRCLDGLGDCPGARFLARLLQEDAALVERLADPNQIELPAAARLIGILRQSDAQIEVRLARLIMPGADPVSAEITNRVLDLIDAVTDGPRLVPVLMHMYRSAPKNIRARLATTISRHHRNHDWVNERLHDSDPRVRANMVQAFWGETASDAIGIFHISLRDIDPRVRGNAALGLHRAGSIEPIKTLVDMAASNAAGDRATAAWVMGACHDERFQVTLAKCIKDPDPLVRRNAFHSLSELKRHREHRRDRIKCDLRFIRPLRAAHGFLHLLFEVKEAVSRKPVKEIRPLDVMPSRNGQPLAEYELIERVNYPQPGVYDLHFEAAAAATPMPRVEVSISTDRHVGTFASDCAPAVTP